MPGQTCSVAFVIVPVTHANFYPAGIWRTALQHGLERCAGTYRKLLLGLFAMPFSLALALQVHAQDSDLSTELRGGLSSAARADLQAQAISVTPTGVDKQELCLFYHKRGMANYRLGNYANAVDDLRAALLNNRAGAVTALQWGDRWGIQGDLHSALTASGDWLGAVQHWRSASREYEHGSPNRYHVSLLLFANSSAVLGNFSDAAAAIREADRTLARLRNTPNWSFWSAYHLYYDSHAKAYLANREGNLAEAERLYKLALDHAEKELELYRRRFPPDHQVTRKAERRRGNSKVALASVLASQARYGEAEYYGRSALEDELQYFDFNTAQIGNALGALGWNRFQQGDLAGAQKYAQSALAAFEAAGVEPHSAALAARRAALANVFVAQERWPEARKLFEERDRGLRSNAKQWKSFGSTAVGWALALLRNGEPQQAAAMAERRIAYELKLPHERSYELAQWRGLLAMAQVDLGETAAALRNFQQAIPELVRRDQGGDEAEDWGYWRVFWRRAIVESYLELLGKLHTTGMAPPGLDVADEAFRMADLARGSSVQEAISAVAARAQLPDRDLADLARRDQDALNRIVALGVVLGRLAAAPENATFAKVIAQREADIERLRAEHLALRAEIRKRFPAYAELMDPPPTGIADVRRMLAANEALVAIYVAPTRTYVWTIGTSGRTSFRVVNLGRAMIESDIARLRRSVDFGEASVEQIPAFDLAGAERLYRDLLAPDEAMWKGARVLNVIPHGALGQLPFGMLVTSPVAAQPAAGAQATYKDVDWLVRKVALAQLPSAAAFVALRRMPDAKPDRRAFVGFGDPDFVAGERSASRRNGVRNLGAPAATDATDAVLAAAGTRSPVSPSTRSSAVSRGDMFALLAVLPDTAEELNAIAGTLKADSERDVYLGRKASETNVKRPGALDHHRVVAFATHGIAPGELAGLDQSALVLSNPALTGETDQDGFLTMEEVLGLKLDADWVVLSACNTASGEGKGADAVSGLGRAFFFAGARTLLVSNWAVETTSARLLTTELFRWQADNPRVSRAEAMRQSMLALIDKMSADGNGGTGFSYAHPAFWAPFSLVGDSGARIATQ